MNQPPELRGTITISLGAEDADGIGSLSIRRSGTALIHWHIVPSAPPRPGDDFRVTPEPELRSLFEDLDGEWKRLNRQPIPTRWIWRTVAAGMALGLALSCLLTIALLVADGAAFGDDLVLRLGAIAAAAGFTAWRCAPTRRVDPC